MQSLLTLNDLWRHESRLDAKKPEVHHRPLSEAGEDLPPDSENKVGNDGNPSKRVFWKPFEVGICDPIGILSRRRILPKCALQVSVEHGRAASPLDLALERLAKALGPYPGWILSARID